MKQEIRDRIFDAMKKSRTMFSTDGEFATKIGISPALYSRLKSGETGIIADNKLLEIAQVLFVDLSETPWKIARTSVYEYIYQQLEHCKQHSISAIFCDVADIGKTVSAKDFARKNSNVVYVDCGLYKTKQQLIRKIAQDFGAYRKGRYHDILLGLISYIKQLDKPMVILDEAGDVHYETFLELKALWNGCENYCSWYMIGANGLKRKIERAIESEKIGYEEMFRRYGKKFQRKTPINEHERLKMIQNDAAQIIKLNAGSKVNVNTILAKTEASLTRIYTEITKTRVEAVNEK